MNHLVKVCQPQPRPQKFLFKLEFLSGLGTQCGARTHNPEVKSHVPYPLSQMGASDWSSRVEFC